MRYRSAGQPPVDEKKNRLKDTKDPTGTVLLSLFVAYYHERASAM